MSLEGVDGLRTLFVALCSSSLLLVHLFARYADLAPLRFKHNPDPRPHRSVLSTLKPIIKRKHIRIPKDITEWYFTAFHVHKVYEL